MLTMTAAKLTSTPAPRRASARRPQARRIDWPRVLREACRLIERDAPSLDALAAQLGAGRAELQRQFTRRLGTSPKAYAQALALHRLAKGSNAGRTALDAVFDAGFGTNSAAYEAAKGALGVTPGQLRTTLQIGWWMGLTDLGWMLLAASERGICWLTFAGEPGALLQEFRGAFPKAELYNDEKRLYAWFERVRDFILLPREALDLPVDVQGTAFQSRVWRALRKIPLGQTRSYTAVAKQLGQPSAVRAVASACASNHVALLIPCHRVVGADGRLAGYRWGLERKRALLEREGGR
jgi:AraC family transcriptional regulator, regulatory protein of adaptative response / methylated-DNA-[protein]-cysteine methyltransferase